MNEKTWGYIAGVLLLMLVVAYFVGNYKGEAINGIAITTFGSLAGVVFGGLLARQFKQDHDKKDGNGNDKKVS